MLRSLCVCCVARCLQKPRDFHEELEDHGQHDNCIAELTFFKLRIERPLDMGISDKQLEMGASSPEVRASQPSLSAPTNSTLLSPARCHASEGLPQHLALAARKK